MSKGKLYLIPSWLSEENSSDQFPADTLSAIHTLTHFIAERAKTARHFLKSVDYPHHFDDVDIRELDKHGEDDLGYLLEACEQGHDCGLLSEAGVPAVADPGGIIVDSAHAKGIEVVPLIGPSSLLLALMASGMNGQRFTFHGYLPREEGELKKRLRWMEQDSQQQDTTHLFIETPYRNDKLMSSICSSLHSKTQLTVAADLTSDGQSIRKMSVGEWKKLSQNISKKPVVFLLFAGNLKT